MSLAEDQTRALVNGLVDCPVAELPPGGEGRFVKASDGASLRVGLWARAGARGSVIISPGRSEFIEKYGEVIGELLARGFAVGVVDWRGQGLSKRMTGDPLRGHIDDFGTYVTDFATLAAGPFAELPKPWLLLGHSMGACIGALILRRLPPMFSAAAFTAPMFGILTGSVPMRIARLIAASAKYGLATRYVPRGSRTSLLEETFEQQVVTHDARRFARAKAIVAAEPRLALGSPTIGWVKAAMAAGDETVASRDPLAVPTLMMLAGEEKLIDNVRSYIVARVPLARLMELEGSRHEILMEVDAVRARFWTAFDKFTSDKLDAGLRGKI